MTSTTRVGDILSGKYRVDGMLGSGGMGIVIAATHLQLHQRVAIKLVRSEVARSDPHVVERFLREARAAVRLRSEHVAKVTDVGVLDDGLPYMVMEYLEGSDLGSVLSERGPLSVPFAADCIVQACEAVAEAHAFGIVHRDLKPPNLFLTRGLAEVPILKVLDFGISKQVTIEGRLTQTAAIMGSPLYMSPEQMRAARHADARSDIWALGVVLYELLTGHRPFEAETMTELCIKVVTEPMRPLGELLPGVPRPIEAIIDRCLQKNPDARYQGTGELAADLEPFISPRFRLCVERALELGRRSSRTPSQVLGHLSGPHTPYPNDSPLRSSAPSRNDTAVAPTQTWLQPSENSVSRQGLSWKSGEPAFVNLQTTHAPSTRAPSPSHPTPARPAGSFRKVAILGALAILGFGTGAAFFLRTTLGVGPKTQDSVNGVESSPPPRQRPTTTPSSTPTSVTAPPVATTSDAVATEVPPTVTATTGAPSSSSARIHPLVPAPSSRAPRSPSGPSTAPEVPPSDQDIPSYR